MARFKDVCLDANDHQALATWWCDVLGYTRRFAQSDRDPSWPVAIVDPAGQGPLLWINPVPEPKTTKNRMHIDIVGDTEEIVAKGARLLRARDDEIDWDILADPEGNEFCVFSDAGAPSPGG